MSLTIPMIALVPFVDLMVLDDNARHSPYFKQLLVEVKQKMYLL